MNHVELEYKRLLPMRASCLSCAIKVGGGLTDCLTFQLTMGRKERKGRKGRQG